MSKKFIVDVRIAASERDSLFTPEWNWPIKQETYDDPLRKFVEWTHALPAQFADKPELRTAFELIEVDLLHDLAYFVGAWIDLSTAKKLDLDLVHGSDQHLYNMLAQDRLDGFSPTHYARAARDPNLRRPMKRLYQLARKTVRNSSAKIKGRPTTHSIGVNPLLLELTGGPRNLFHLSYANIVAQRPTIQHPDPVIGELAREIQQQLSKRLADVDHAPTEKLNSHIQRLVTNHLINGWSDKDFKPEFTPTPKMTLFTGTGGGYISRTLSHAFQKNGAKVVRATHGGESVDYPDFAHAVANSYFMAASNRVGTEAPWGIGKFYGTSYFVDPRGKIMAEGSIENDELVHDGHAIYELVPNDLHDWADRGHLVPAWDADRKRPFTLGGDDGADSLCIEPYLERPDPCHFRIPSRWCR